VSPDRLPDRSPAALTGALPGVLPGALPAVLIEGALALAEHVAARRAAPGTAWDLLAADALVAEAFAQAAGPLAPPDSVEDDASAEARLRDVVMLAETAGAALARRAEEDPG
jgi:hypothetical protein